MASETNNFTAYFEVEAVGQRIGLMTCKKCGAAVLLGDAPPVDAPGLHIKWHLSRAREMGVGEEL
jgi:hypothetical protein